MDDFTYKQDKLCCENVPLNEVARACGTPVYVYSRATLVKHCRALLDAFDGYPTTACFAVKANSNLSILKLIFGEGLGADLVSVGELERALLAGADPKKIVFSGVGKRDDEIARALEVGIKSFNVESTYELDAISKLATARGTKAKISLRVNPNIDAKTNPKIATGLHSTKFGLTEAELPALVDRILRDSALALVGVGCHIGSQITELAPIVEASRRMAEIAKGLKARGAPLSFLDLGGGLGIRYADETPPSLEEYARALVAAVRPTGLELVIEPGRVLVGNAGVLVTKVLGVKQTPARHFIVLDAAMNDLMRPSLYDAYHDIVPAVPTKPGEARVLCDFVGPVCETGDILGTDRQVVLPHAGALYAIRSAGAYGSSMASQYNSRPRAPEVLIDGAAWKVVRRRESLSALWADELAALDQ